MKPERAAYIDAWLDQGGGETITDLARSMRTDYSHTRRMVVERCEVRGIDFAAMVAQRRQLRCGGQKTATTEHWEMVRAWVLDPRERALTAANRIGIGSGLLYYIAYRIMANEGIDRAEWKRKMRRLHIPSNGGKQRAKEERMRSDADLIRLYRAGMRRIDIAEELQLALSTINDRIYVLQKAGVLAKRDDRGRVREGDVPADFIARLRDAMEPEQLVQWRRAFEARWGWDRGRFTVNGVMLDRNKMKGTNQRWISMKYVETST